MGREVDPQHELALHKGIEDSFIQTGGRLAYMAAEIDMLVNVLQTWRCYQWNKKHDYQMRVGEMVEVPVKKREGLKLSQNVWEKIN